MGYLGVFGVADQEFYISLSPSSGVEPEMRHSFKC
jgi:hypothetical protein